MTEDIIKLLKEEEHPEGIQELLGHLNAMLKFSRGKMKGQNARWDRNLKVWRGERCPDEKDIDASENDEPEKMVIPTSYSQTMTFVTFAFMLYTQNQPLFRMGPTGNEDYDLSETCETTLDRDVRKNQFNVKLFQLLLDAARFGLTCVKTSWKKEIQFVNVPQQTEMLEVEGFSFADTEINVEQEFIRYEGNDFVVVSPYRLIPDMRLPLTRWKEGRFVADEQDYHFSWVKEQESLNVFAGTEFIEKFSKKSFEDSNRWMGQWSAVEKDFSKSGSDEDDFMVVNTEMNVRMNLHKYIPSLPNREDLYLICIANDNRIIRIEPANYFHGEFIYDLGQFTPDQHAELNMALADTVDALQDVITWLINGRLMSLKQGLDRHLVVDPLAIDTVGLDQRSPIILLKKTAPRTGIANFIQQIKYTDMSQQNMAEAESLMKIMQMVTGVNENAMGQYAPGRRSASENRAANQGASSRMTLHATLLYDQVLQPMAQKALINQRQNMSFETFVKIVGKTSPTPPYTIEELFEQFAPIDQTSLIGNEDFFVFDAMSSNEKVYLAQSIQELVIALIGNPAVIPLTNYNLTKLIDELQYLRGIRNVGRFKNDPSGQSVIPGMPGQVGAVDPGTGAPVVPGQQVVSDVPAGAPGGVPVS